MLAFLAIDAAGHIASLLMCNCLELSSLNCPWWHCAGAAEPIGSVGSLRQGLSMLPVMPPDSEEDWAVEDSVMMGTTPSVSILGGQNRTVSPILLPF